MNYYQTELARIRNQFFAKEDLIKRVIQGKRFIDSNFSKRLNLNTIAGRAYIAKFHFIRTFKTFYGLTPHQYLTSVRIQNAKKLLRRNYSVSEVCLAVGFESVNSFTNLFKKITGTPPAFFRDRQNTKSNFR